MDGEAKIKTHKETRKLLMNAKDTGQKAAGYKRAVQKVKRTDLYLLVK